jgi:putative Holliday junction resolvase
LNFSKYLAIDYGEKRIGIAISDFDKSIAFPRDHILNDSKLFQKILVLIKEETIEKIILGYPINLNSKKTPQTQKVEDFKTELEKFLLSKDVTTEVVLVDERLTSSIAESYMTEMGLKKSRRQEKGIIDSIAAQVLLQGYLDKETHLRKD